MQKSVTNTFSSTICPLYRIVYDTRYIKTVVFVLLASMFVQPVSLAYAAELTEENIPISAESAAVEVSDVAVVANDIEASSESEEEIAETPSDPQIEVVSVDDEDEFEEVAVETESSVFEAATSTAPIDEDFVASTTEVIVLETGASSVTTTTESEVSPANEDTSDEIVYNQPESEAVNATATEPLVAKVENNTNYHQFSKDQCVAVGDGSFYCGESQQAEIVPEDSFYTALDHDGDQEIFARIDGKTTQITSNTLDDAAPYYDAVSETVVWHRAIDERYQIVSYDIKSGKEEILTDDRVNNMQPTRYGDITVWQQWGENSWEIVLLEDGEITRLTNDVHHDIAPSIRGEYILWKTNQNDTQVISVYTIATGKTEIITDSAVGMSVSNPRMVLVYDGYTENGDRVTRGYDPETGDVIPLSSIPAPMPTNIPDSEPVKETRALIQVKSPVGRDELDDQDLQNLPPTPVASSTPNIASSTTNIPDVDLSEIPEISATTTQNNIPDVVVPSTSTTTGSVTTEVEENLDLELVIPPASTSTES